ncbi:MAG: hypothetical protein EXQ97_08495 [Alphaproteobacteria bacterium]|nr:hypothetical protein [Alphaproteobacteria bacterium]
MFSRFGGMTDERSRRTIAHGRRIRAALAQDQYAPLDKLEQVALLTELNADTLYKLDQAQVTAFKARLPAAIAALGNAPAASLAATGMLPVDVRTVLLAALARFADSVVAAAA